MIIEKIEAIPFRIPLKKASRWGAHGKRDAQDHVLIRVTSESGKVGTAEAPARPTIYGETQRSIVHIVRDTLAPMLKGVDALDVQGYQAKLAAIPWNPTAKAAVDTAMHDVAAQELGVNLARHLGGQLRPVEVSWMLSLNFADDAEFVREATDVRDRYGIRAFKVKAGSDPAGDIRRMKLLREALGDDALLFIDANQLYAPDVAIRTIRAMEPYNLAMAEEPVAIGLGQWRKKVADAVATPLLADDSVFSLTDVRRELQDGAIGVMGIKIARTGMYESTRIVHAAEAYGLPCWIGSQGVSGIGAVASAHFAAAFRSVSYPADLSTPLKQEDDLLARPIDIREGRLHVADVPGIGAEVDEDKLAKYRLDW
ncbi:mandelate racemase/muconate lactonizing enzyme family protein [Paracidovorax cattleyae]|uniref:L-alanine-DL-glutamate epimerase n=1 Tax=Paracidovorax cattleyae TaxID=80868 RepID=A0A1H0WA47_9BURK|nr:enolase C-terminal domain-like protein [Paracidovorax cattleyae]SDP87650.1 L-alanine-DL-glutamate epimerase [Paracidovorax cattleyae]